MLTEFETAMSEQTHADLLAQLAAANAAAARAESKARLERLCANWWGSTCNPMIPRINELARLVDAGQLEQAAALCWHLDGQLGHAPRPRHVAPAVVTEYSVSLGKEKSPKPAPLKGIPMSGKVVAGRGKKPPAAQIFTPADGTVWAHHPDYFAPEVDLPPAMDGAPLEARLAAIGATRSLKRFIYADAWGGIATRRRAWLRIDGLDPSAGFAVNLGMVMRAHEATIGVPRFFLEIGQWQRFWADLVAHVRAVASAA